MFASTLSVSLVGGTVSAVRVEAHVGRQKEAFKLSGLPDTAVREAKDRVKAAVASAGINFPNRTITVNLAPADMPKAGTDYDLPIALGILAASREVPRPSEFIIVGELALDGTVRPGSHGLGAGVLSQRLGMPCLVSESIAPEAATVPGSRVFGVRSLAHAVEVLRLGLDGVEPAQPGPASIGEPVPDLSDLRGQPVARRALEVAAAGGHHLLLHGPPGGGKTMLARRLPGILPPLSDEEAIEVALIWAAAGRRREVNGPPPFRAPHHTATKAALVGGGTGMPVPGEISLAHHGVLFLDELAEYPRGHLDTLRQPLEEGHITVARQGSSLSFPAEFQLVAATNPCPCGYFGDRRHPCECDPGQRFRYRSRVSGPLIDRFDLVVKVGRVDATAFGGPAGEASETVRGRVVTAREAQRRRGVVNVMARTDGMEISGPARKMVIDALTRGVLTARGAVRVQRVARTVADLAGLDSVERASVEEAMALRGEWREA